MDSEASTTGAALPRSTPFDPGASARAAAAGPPSAEAGAVAADDARDRTGVFGHLVHDDADIAGLVAYSIYKQHKLDWLRAFEKAKNRVPDEKELSSYIIGEGTPRRLATYRHLAEATLAGHGPEVGGASGRLAGSRVRPILADRRSYVGGLTLIYGLIAVLFVLGFWLAMRFTMSTR